MRRDILPKKLRGAARLGLNDFRNVAAEGYLSKEFLAVITVFESIVVLFPAFELRIEVVQIAPNSAGCERGHLRCRAVQMHRSSRSSNAAYSLIV